MRAAKPRCQRCRRKHRGYGDWNLVLAHGVVVGALCPTCQTPEENAEAEINLATTEYGTDAFGRVLGRPLRAGPLG